MSEHSKQLNFYPKAVENILNLKRCREEKGLTRKGLAELINLPANSISEYERGKNMPLTKSYDKIARFFGWATIEEFDITVEDLRAEEARQIMAVRMREEALNFKFKVGEVYYIDVWNFIYEGQRGIHHCFRALQGGWSRTYTNNQLVGKTIKSSRRRKHE